MAKPEDTHPPSPVLATHIPKAGSAGTVIHRRVHKKGPFAYGTRIRGGGGGGGAAFSPPDESSQGLGGIGQRFMTLASPAAVFRVGLGRREEGEVSCCSSRKCARTVCVVVHTTFPLRKK